MTQPHLTEADLLIAEDKAVQAARENAKAIIAAGKRFDATAAAVNEAILNGTGAEEFAHHHEVEMLARRIAA